MSEGAPHRHRDRRFVGDRRRDRARALGSVGRSARAPPRAGRLETVAHEVEQAGGRAAALALDRRARVDRRLLRRLRERAGPADVL
jgi:hypothetical protein